MKNISTKLNLIFLLVCLFTIGSSSLQKSYAAFPGKKKQEQNTSVQTQKSNSELKSVELEKILDNQQKSDDDKVLLIILAFILPPLAVYMYFDEWNKTCTLNLILTLLCGLPGLIHALIVILGKK
ncbi:MAG: YqaE/Pmp3 family membrane protein [Saprospiraceae bacterium]|nr:YqaE/Pmp3 family membrane protein [Saprospiraceae bacterium]